VDFPGNSNTSKQQQAKPRRKEPTQKGSKQEKKVEKVVTGEVIKKPKSLGRRTKDIFLGEELKTAGRYILQDVLVPALKNLMVDTTTKGIERVIYGDQPSIRRTQVGGSQTRISYNTPVNRSRLLANLPDQPSVPRPIHGRRRHNVDDILLASSQEAELVVEGLKNIIEQYEAASVADLYELIGMPSAYTDNQWGWYVLHPVNIRQVREGYLIDLPPVEPI
jgi:hypothetical protein